MSQLSKTERDNRQINANIAAPVSLRAKTFWLFMDEKIPGKLKTIGIFARKPAKATQEYFGGKLVKVRVIS